MGSKRSRATNFALEMSGSKLEDFAPDMDPTYSSKRGAPLRLLQLKGISTLAYLELTEYCWPCQSVAQASGVEPCVYCCYLRMPQLED